MAQEKNSTALTELLVSPFNEPDKNKGTVVPSVRIEEKHEDILLNVYIENDLFDISSICIYFISGMIKSIRRILRG